MADAPVPPVVARVMHVAHGEYIERTRTSGAIIRLTIISSEHLEDFIT
jgi:hypothetical protein